MKRGRASTSCIFAVTAFRFWRRPDDIPTMQLLGRQDLVSSKSCFQILNTSLSIPRRRAPEGSQGSTSAGTRSGTPICILKRGDAFSGPRSKACAGERFPADSYRRQDVFVRLTRGDARRQACGECDSSLTQPALIPAAAAGSSQASDAMHEHCRGHDHCGRDRHDHHRGSGSRSSSTGKFRAIQLAKPPSSGWTRVIPLRLS